MNDRIVKLQALLLTSGGGIPKKRLATLLSCKEGRLTALLKEAQERYKTSGILIVDDGAQVSLATDPSLLPFLAETEKGERELPLSRASQETLAVISYAGPLSKGDIDFIRGVNTSYTLRRLLVRGLIRRSPGRTFSVSADLLVHLGISSVEDLPDYEQIHASLREAIQSVRQRAHEERV